MGSALQKLAALNRMTWIQGPWQAPQAGAAEAPAKPSRSPCSAGLPAALMHPTAVYRPRREGAVTVHHLQAALPVMILWASTECLRIAVSAVRNDPSAHLIPRLTCRPSANGYEALPGNEVEDEKKAAKEQEELEDKYEKMLMDVYDTLYKVQSHHLMLSTHDTFQVWQCASYFLI